ncbi:hypothetical protein [Bacillus safensis]|uniref:hypothetical protein n=1 Tax=Bacillus safensis TaxID=561879 RepID=UPI003983B4E3
MKLNKPLKLSNLPHHIEVGNEETHDIYMVAELIDEIRDGETSPEGNWFLIKRRRWEPSANAMIDRYIEAEHEEMYEGWAERADDCFTKEVVEKIQEVLNHAFRGDYATSYWTYEQRVEIDIFPQLKEGAQ